jgi:hypothetical protein
VHDTCRRIRSGEPVHRGERDWDGGHSRSVPYREPSGPCDSSPAETSARSRVSQFERILRISTRISGRSRSRRLAVRARAGSRYHRSRRALRGSVRRRSHRQRYWSTERLREFAACVPASIYQRLRRPVEKTAVGRGLRDGPASAGRGRRGVGKAVSQTKPFSTAGARRSARRNRAPLRTSLVAGQATFRAVFICGA